MPQQSRHRAAKVYRLVPIPKGGQGGGAQHRRLALRSWPLVGARVAPQQSPIFRPGQRWL